MKKIMIVSISIVCVAMISFAIAAGPGRAGWHHSPEEKIAFIKNKLTDKLELNDAQIETLDRIGNEILAEHNQLKDSHKAFKASLMETLSKESVQPEEFKALFDTKKPVIQELMQSAAEHLAEFHSVLTPEQRATLVAEIESHKGGRCRFFR